MSATDALNQHVGSSADDFFAEEGLLVEIEATAVARLLRTANTGADLDFLVDKSGTPMTREND